MFSSKEKTKIRYAVVGLGHIAQKAVLPAFKNARKNSKREVLVSGDKYRMEYHHQTNLPNTESYVVTL